MSTTRDRPRAVSIVLKPEPETASRSHPIQVCDRRLKSLPNYDPFRCQPSEFICSCGRHWVHVCDEAEGCFYSDES